MRVDGGVGVITLDLDDPAQVTAVDAFVEGMVDGTPFHRPAWIKAVERGTGNRAHMLAVVASSGQIAGLLPLTHMKSRLFGEALVSSGFAVDGGILASDSAISLALASAAEGFARDRGVASVELRGGSSPGEGWTIHEGSHLGFVRPIAADDEGELLAVPRKHRAELRKALANPALRVEVGRDDHLVRAHYDVYAQSVRNLGTPVFPRRLFREVLAAFGEDADILIVYEDDRPISGVLTLYHQGRVMPFWGGGVAEARRLRSNELMYYRLMGHGRTRGMRLFDFGRSKTGSGQAAWKKSFGFDPVPLAYHSWSATGERRDINPNSAQYQRRVEMWKKLPLPIANLIGPLISRGLG